MQQRQRTIIVVFKCFMVVCPGTNARLTRISVANVQTIDKWAFVFSRTYTHKQCTLHTNTCIRARFVYASMKEKLIFFHFEGAFHQTYLMEIHARISYTHTHAKNKSTLLLQRWTATSKYKWFRETQIPANGNGMQIAFTKYDIFVFVGSC